MLFYLVARYGKRWILKLINREDELPVFLTFSAVICIAFMSQAIGLPETLMVIAFGAALASTDPRSFEHQARPFKDVFLIVFFVFFGIGVDFSGGFPVVRYHCHQHPRHRFETGVRPPDRAGGSRAGTFRDRDLGEYDRQGGILHRPCIAIRFGRGFCSDCRDGHYHFGGRIVRSKIQRMFSAAYSTGSGIRAGPDREEQSIGLSQVLHAS